MGRSSLSATTLASLATEGTIHERMPFMHFMRLVMKDRTVIFLLDKLSEGRCHYHATAPGLAQGCRDHIADGIEIKMPEHILNLTLALLVGDDLPHKHGENLHTGSLFRNLPGGRPNSVILSSTAAPTPARHCLQRWGRVPFSVELVRKDGHDDFTMNQCATELTVKSFSHRTIQSRNTPTALLSEPTEKRLEGQTIDASMSCQICSSDNSGRHHMRLELRVALARGCTVCQVLRRKQHASIVDHIRVIQTQLVDARYQRKKHTVDFFFFE